MVAKDRNGLAVTGLPGLVPASELLARLAGSRHGAVDAAERLLRGGPRALSGRDDVTVAAKAALLRAGVISESGGVDRARAAELVVVCSVLAASTMPEPTPAPDPRLVLTAPAGAAPVQDVERLEGFVLDVIRQATSELHIGGAFWNEAGFDLLNAVLLPAVEVRGVPTTIYANLPDLEHREAFLRRVDTLAAAGPVTIRWFTGGRPRMLHAKFVIRDRRHGYLGTANLTSWGMQEHVEAGVELTAGQSARFVRFLEDLESAGLFSDRLPA